MDISVSGEDGAKRRMIEDLVMPATARQIAALAEAAVSNRDEAAKVSILFSRAEESAARFAIDHDIHPFAAASVLVAAGQIERDHPLAAGIDGTTEIISRTGRTGFSMWAGQYAGAIGTSDAHADYARQIGLAAIAEDAKKGDVDVAEIAVRSERAAIAIGKDIKSGAIDDVEHVRDWARVMAGVSIEVARSERVFPPLDRAVARNGREME